MDVALLGLEGGTRIREAEISESVGKNRLGIRNERVRQRRPSQLFWASGDGGRPSSSEIKAPVCRSCTDKEKATDRAAKGEAPDGHGGVEAPEHVSKFQAREPGDPADIRLLEGTSRKRGQSTTLDRMQKYHAATDLVSVRTCAPGGTAT